MARCQSTNLTAALKLVSRDNVECVKCNDTSELTCPACGDGKECQFTVPSNCGECPSAVCYAVDDSSSSGSGSSSGGSSKSDGGDSGPNAGAIAGGVIGGIAAIAIITYLVWRFLVKPKRSQMPQSIYESETNAVRDNTEKDGASRMTKRSSTHTVHSIASTVLTRASNIIQIAYIPGVTNRATPTSPGVLVPPVPPIPMHHTEGYRDTDQEEQHYFVPGDLRDSTYSGISGYSDRTSYARTSYAPRSSIASTIYGKQAQVLTPAQTGMRAKPTMVSVKSLGSNGGATPPPVPSIDFEKFGNGRPKSGASAFSVGSTFLNNANTATQARAQVVKVGGGLKQIQIGNKSDANTSSPNSLAPPSPNTPGQSSVRDSAAVTLIDDSPAMDQGPFSDPPKVVASPGLGAVMEDDESRRSGDRTSRPSSSRMRGTSPFGDEHATRD